MIEMTHDVYQDLTFERERELFHTCLQCKPHRSPLLQNFGLAASAVRETLTTTKAKLEFLEAITNEGTGRLYRQYLEEGHNEIWKEQSEDSIPCKLLCISPLQGCLL